MIEDNASLFDVLGTMMSIVESDPANEEAIGNAKFACGIWDEKGKIIVIHPNGFVLKKDKSGKITHFLLKCGTLNDLYEKVRDSQN